MIFSFFLNSFAVIAAAAVIGARAESHTINFVNNCGFGTQTLVLGGNILSTGGAVTVNGPIASAVAYLQTGACGLNGEGCTAVDITLMNAGNGSSVDISVAPPHAFTAPVKFAFTSNQCPGGACTNAICVINILSASSSEDAITCKVDNVGLIVTFCP